MSTLATNILLPSFGSIARDMHVPVLGVAQVLSIFFGVFAVFQLVAGPLSDAWGRSVTIKLSLAALALGSFLCAACDSFNALLMGRVLQAAGAAGAAVSSRAIARDLLDNERLAKALSFVLVVSAVSPGFSPLVGSLFENHLSWRASFVFIAAFALLTWFLHTLWIGETLPIGLRVQSTGVGVVSDYFGLLKQSQFALPGVSAGALIGALFSLFGAAPAILSLRFGLSPFALSLFFATTVFAVFAAGLLARRLTGRLAPRLIVYIGSTLALLAGLLLFLGEFTAESSLLTFSLATTIFLVGMGVSTPVASAMALTPFASQAGRVSALIGFLQMLSAAIGVILVERLPWGAVGNLASVLCAFGGLALLCCIRIATSDQPLGAQRHTHAGSRPLRELEADSPGTDHR